MTPACSSSGGAEAADANVAAGADAAALGPAPPPQSFVLVVGSGDGGAVDGVFRSLGRRWLGCDVLESLCGECILSREVQVSARSGARRHGFVLGIGGKALYGARTEELQVPKEGWKALAGTPPAPTVKVFAAWNEACRAGALHFGAQATVAAKLDDWGASRRMADVAISCQAQARPRLRRDDLGGGWAKQLCELLATRAEALLHLGEAEAALADACRAVGFLDVFDWSRARTRGVAALLALDVTEAQAQLLMEAASRREPVWSPPPELGIRQEDGPLAREHELGDSELGPFVAALLASARRGELAAIELRDATPDDGRLYFRVVDPEECVPRAAPSADAPVLGRALDLGAVVRGEQLVKDGEWLELHVSETWDTSSGHDRAYVPILWEDDEAGEREEVLERLRPGEYPPAPVWEALGLSVKPAGLKPLADAAWLATWRDLPRPSNQGRWPFEYKPRLALASVVPRGIPESIVDSFIRYHWGIGFNHIALYFDDPNDPALAVARALEKRCGQIEDVDLAVVPLDAAWWARARRSSRFFRRRDASADPMYESVCRLEERGEFAGREIIALDVAVVAAHAAGAAWFLALGINECMYVPQQLDCSVRRFFGSSLTSTTQAVRLWSHVAVAPCAAAGAEAASSEGRGRATDWFWECTMFQISLHHCRGFPPPREFDELLRQREGREFEVGADDGKEIEEAWWWRNLCEEVREQRRPVARELGLLSADEPVAFHISESRCGGSAGDYSRGRLAVRLDKLNKPPVPYGGRYGFLDDSGGVLQECYQACGSQDAVVLHYPAVSFSMWQERLPPTLRRLLPSERQQEQYYQEFVVQNEHNELSVLAEHGMVQVIDGVKKLLSGWDNPADADELLPGQQRWRHPETGLLVAAPDGR